MSFGFSISDLAVLFNLSRKIYRDCKYAGREYADISQELRSLQNVLKVLYEEFESADSPLAREDLGYASRLKETTAGCKDILTQLKTRLGRHRALQDNAVRGRRRLWRKVKFGTQELEELDLIRRKLVSYISSLAVLLDTFQLAATDRMERKVDYVSEHMGEVLGHIASAACGRHRLGSALTLSTHPEDDKEVWRQFRRELLLEGFGSQKLYRHKNVIKGYMKGLDKWGTSNGPASPKLLVTHGINTAPRLGVQSQSAKAPHLTDGMVDDMWTSSASDTSDLYDSSDLTSMSDEDEAELHNQPNYALFPLGYPPVPFRPARGMKRKTEDLVRSIMPLYLTSHARPISVTLSKQSSLTYVMMDMVIFNAKARSSDNFRRYYYERQDSQIAGLSVSRYNILDDSGQFMFCTLERGQCLEEEDFRFMRTYTGQAEDMFEYGTLDRLVAVADKIFFGNQLEGLTSWRLTTPDLYVRLPTAAPYNPYNPMHPRLQTHQQPPYSQITFTCDEKQYPHAFVLIHDYTVITESGSIRRTNLADILRELTYCFLILIRGHTELNTAAFNKEFADIRHRIDHWFQPRPMLIDQRIRCVQSDLNDFPWSFLLIGSLG